MNIKQGDLFWVSPNEVNNISSDYTHPHVVIQVNVSTVNICAITSNLKHAKEIGYVLLDEGEANLTKQSVVVASKMFTTDIKQLDKYIGSLTEQRVQQILASMRFLDAMTQRREKEVL